MSTVAVTTSIRRLSLVPIARGASPISEIPPPITLGTPPRARRVSLEELSPIVQERFESAIRGTFPPSPLLRSLRPRTGSRAAWVALAMAASIAGVVLASRGYGSLGGAGALQPGAVALVYGAIVSTIVFAALRFFAVAVTARALPWPAGVYVFPTVLVDARTTTLDVLPLVDLESVETDVHTRRVRLVFTNGRTFGFALGDGEDLAGTISDLEEARVRAKDLAANADASACALADPLFESPEAPPLTVARRSPSVPMWARHAGWLAVIAGILAGPVVHRARNAASDAKAFRQASARDDAESWRKYLASAGSQRAKVEGELLPRADARERRAALRRELEGAVAQGTLAALDVFAVAHPDAALDDELRDARHAVFVRTLDRYRTRAPNDEAFAFAARLLAVAEVRGPRVEVQFQREPSPTLKDADAAVEGSNKFAGMVSHPSPWLAPPNDDVAEAAFVAALHARFAEVFPEEILDVVAPTPESGGFDGPAIVVRHHVEWSGELIAVQGFPGILVGTRFVFDAAFVLPDGGPPRGLATTIEARPDATPLERVEGAPAPEQAIYAAMSAKAFDALRGDVVSLLF